MREALDLYFQRLEADPDDLERLRSHLMFATLHLQNIVSGDDDQDDVGECGCICGRVKGEDEPERDGGDS